MAVVGASGCGKSSVVRAGLILRLRESRTAPVWEAVTLVPGERPLRSLAAALLPLLEPELTEVDRLAEANKLAAHLAGQDVALGEVVGRVLQKQTGTDRLLLVVDQWEELYTLTREDSERRSFMDEILQATERGPLTVALTLRGDFFGQALAYRPLADRLQDAVVNLGPMNREELQQAVVSPAQKVNLAFEPGLMERILDDVGSEPGHLPLLEFALTTLWEQRRGGYLLHEAYEAMGKVEGAIARRAEEQYTHLSPLEQQAVSRVFLELVRPGAGCDDTRRRARLTDIGETVRPLVQQLADARLLVTGRDAASGAETVEVAHEALIQHWHRLQGWLDVDREFLLWRQRLRAALEEWQLTGQDPEVLLRGKPLAEARHWLEDRPQDLLDTELRFIQASASLQENREEEERQRQRRELEQAQALAEEQRQRAESEQRARKRFKWLSAGLSVLFLVAVAAAFFAIHKTKVANEQAQLAQQQSKIALSRQLAAQADKLADSRLDLALLLGVEAFQVEPTLEARDSLLTLLRKHPDVSRLLQGHTNLVNSVAFSPDGKILASGSKDKTIILWDVEQGRPIGQPLTGHKGRVNGVAFSPDGKKLASGDDDKTIILWDLEQEIGQLLKQHEGTVWSVAYSPDGKKLASGSADKTVILWDLAARQTMGTSLTTLKDLVFSVASSPEGKKSASGRAGNTNFLSNVNVESWLNRARHMANRNLTKEEWHKYMGDLPYHKTCPDLPEPEK